MRNFAVEAVVACDEVRLEANQKQFLIGVYPDGVMVPEIPSVMLVGFWIQLSILNDVAKTEIFMQTKTPDGADGPTANYQLQDLKRATSFPLTFPSMPHAISKTGFINLNIKEGKGPWKKIKSLRVEAVPPNPDTA